MKAAQLKELLVGQQIADITYTEYMDRGMCIEKIRFGNGAILELEGHCDFAAVSGYLPPGEDEVISAWVSVDPPEDFEPF